MITIHLNTRDLANIRFAFSPITEAITSYRALRDPARHMLYLKWITESRDALQKVNFDFSILDALIQPTGYLPDFLTPSPAASNPSFADEIEAMRKLPPDLIRENIDRMSKRESFPSEKKEIAAWIELFKAKPAEAREKVILALEVYWDHILASHWPRIQANLEGDMLYRAQRLALGGPVALFANLHPMVTYEKKKLIIKKPFERVVKSNGRGLTLLPVMFCWPDLYVQLGEPWQPAISYSPRGAALWSGKTPDPHESLSETLGAGRARVLAALTTPANTSELAESLELTPGGVSQHLARLQRAGLVEPFRHGRHVFYRLTQRGESLLCLFQG